MHVYFQPHAVEDDDVAGTAGVYRSLRRQLPSMPHYEGSRGSETEKGERSISVWFWTKPKQRFPDEYPIALEEEVQNAFQGLAPF